MPTSRRALALATAALLVHLAPAALAQPEEDLAAYFGFDPHRTLVIDDDCGPVVHADFNNDGRPDLAIVNNRKSRIEIYTLRAEPRSDAELERDLRVNDIRPSRYYDRTDISVRRRIGALAALDADADGRPDLLYASSSTSELVLLRQVAPDRFEVADTLRMTELLATPSALAVADFAGAPAVACIAGGRLHLVPIVNADFKTPRPLGPKAPLRAVFIEDFDADAAPDLLTVAPAEPEPLRLWLQRSAGPAPATADTARFPAELRFEMPALAEAEPVRFPDRDAASIAVIERASRRVVLYDLDTVDLARDRTRVQAEVVPFPGGAENAALIAADLNADNLTDLIATRPDANSIALTLTSTTGVAAPTESPTFKQPAAIDAGPWPTGENADAPMAVFVLSEDENAVGVSRLDRDNTLTFPQPITLATPGATPLTLRHVTLGDRGPALAVVVRKRRDLFLEIHFPPGPAGVPALRPFAVELQRVTKPPTAILANDADRDGFTDLLLLTPGEPMIMLPGAAPGENGPDDPAAPFAAILQSDDMPQFGLVSAAGPDNTLLHDIDRDGFPELLFAASNFIRVAAYDRPSDTDPGGWRVVRQINADNPAADFVALARLDADQAYIAADAGLDRLVTFERDRDAFFQAPNPIRVDGVDLGRLIAGPFGPRAAPAVLAVGRDGYALIPLAGERRVLTEVAVYRADSEDRVEHEIEVGDVNNDGYTDLVVLDAGEQFCQILTLTASRRILEATEFKVFESRLFSRGNQREFEPSAALIADLTGDGRDDILLLVHDRVIIYPQQTP